MTQTISELQAEGKIPEILDFFPRQGHWTEEDYFNLPETNRIVELSEGRLIITPAPTDQHQRIVGELYFLIRSFLLKNNLGEVRLSPLDIRLWRDNIRQPDIVFVCNEHKDRISNKYWGVPDLVIEVTSENTEKQDRIEKFYEYEKAGVLEYWIVDPFQQIIEVFTMRKETYTLYGKWSVSEIAKSGLLTGFEVKINELMK